MTKYVGTFTITVEGTDEANLCLLSEEIGDASRRLGLTRTAESASLIVIEEVV